MGQQTLWHNHQPQGKLHGCFEHHRWGTTLSTPAFLCHLRDIFNNHFPLSMLLILSLMFILSKFSQVVFKICYRHIFLWALTILRVIFLYYFFFRRRLSQLPSHVPLWLRHQWVWLQAQPHHCLHRPDVLPGSGQRPQEGVQGHHPRPRAEDGRR